MPGFESATQAFLFFLRLNYFSFFPQLVRYFLLLFLAVLMTACNEADILRFFFFCGLYLPYACTLSVGFVLLSYVVFGSQVANSFMLLLNSLLTTFEIEFVFPCIHKGFFFVPLAYQH